MANDCFNGNWWYKEMDEEGAFFDINGDQIIHWMGWTDHMGQAIDDQMCAMQESLAGSITDLETAHDNDVASLQTQIQNIPTPGPPTGAQVRTALGAPGAAITPAAGGGNLATVQVLGLTVVAGSSVTQLQNVITRVNEIEARLKSLGLLS